MWRQEGERYQADSVAEAVGFISFFYGRKLIQRATGYFDGAGLVPAEYTLDRGTREKAEVARYAAMARSEEGFRAYLSGFLSQRKQVA